MHQVFGIFCVSFVHGVDVLCTLLMFSFIVAKYHCLQVHILCDSQYNFLVLLLLVINDHLMFVYSMCSYSYSISELRLHESVKPVSTCMESRDTNNLDLNVAKVRLNHIIGFFPPICFLLFYRWVIEMVVFVTFHSFKYIFGHSNAEAGTVYKRVQVVRLTLDLQEKEKTLPIILS